jgi:hypothetical protein
MKISLSLRYVAWLTIGLTIGSLLSIATPSQAKSTVKFKPRGGPGRTVGAASRSGDLVALTPRNGAGLTTSAYPTVLVNIPNKINPKGSNLTLCLVSTDQRSQDGQPRPDTLITQKTFVAPNSNGIILLDFQDLALPELKINTPYKWTVGISKPDETFSCGLRSGNLASGTIERVATTSKLDKALRGNDPIAQAKAYAAAGIWYDSLQIMAELRRTNPNDPQINEHWQSLLESGKLSNQSNSPFAACCQMR